MGGLLALWHRGCLRGRWDRCGSFSEGARSDAGLPIRKAWQGRRRGGL